MDQLYWNCFSPHCHVHCVSESIFMKDNVNDVWSKRNSRCERTSICKKRKWLLHVEVPDVAVEKTRQPVSMAWSILNSLLRISTTRMSAGTWHPTKIQQKQIVSFLSIRKNSIKSTCFAQRLQQKCFACNLKPQQCLLEQDLQPVQLTEDLHPKEV